MQNYTPHKNCPPPTYRPRVLIFVVAYNAAATIASVLSRIPLDELNDYILEVLVIDDCSTDDTLTRCKEISGGFPVPIRVVRTPMNLGYGGNQKLGYSYAVRHGFDYVVLLHGDGQYAPEAMPTLLAAFTDGTDAVFGSRMLNKLNALKGGMPLYKWLGNQLLTAYQNFMMGASLSEWHSGYRLYRVDSLRRLPYDRNSDGFAFDNEIIVQALLAGMTIREVPIPTFYGDEHCHVDGLAYAWAIFKCLLRVQTQRFGLCYDPKFDCTTQGEAYSLKLGYESSHTVALKLVSKGARILDVGCGQGLVAREMLASGAREVVGLDAVLPQPVRVPGAHFYKWNLNNSQLPAMAEHFDQIFMLDIIEHLTDPERFLRSLRESAGLKCPQFVITTANISFLPMRILLALGQFNYGKAGILDRTHTRLFTFASLTECLQQQGYVIQKVQGIPVPFPKALGDNWFARSLLAINSALCQFPLTRNLASYQILVVGVVRPPLSALTHYTFKLDNNQQQDCCSASASAEDVSYA